MSKALKKYLVKQELNFTVEFYDVDTMGVVWHGNYIKYMEAVRCALYEKLGYGYKTMAGEGYAFPITTMNAKYIRSLEFGEKAKIIAYLLEYDGVVKIAYEIYNERQEICVKAETTQIAVKWETRETQFNCPENFIKGVKNTISEESSNKT